jgi:hypothetical protein
LASEVGGAAFEEGAASFLDVVWSPPRQQEAKGLMAQLLFERRFHALLQGAPCRLHGNWWPGGNGLGQRHGFLQEFVGRDQPIQETNTIRLLGFNKATGVNQVTGTA